MHNKFNIILLLYFSLLTLFLSCTDEAEIMVGVENGRKLDERDLVPFILEQNYPNPYNPVTTIPYQVGSPLHLVLKVYTEDWLEIATLVDKYHDSGYYKAHFSSNNVNNRNLPTGEYYYTLSGNDITLIRKMKLIK